jgi:hypothetical protein
MLENETRRWAETKQTQRKQQPKGSKKMPVKGYDSVNLPSGLYDKVKSLVKARADLGYRSITEFVAEAVRKRTEEIEKTNSPESNG